MEYTKILFEEINGVGILTLNDPENHNTIAFNATDKEIMHCLNECQANPNVRAIVLKGNGIYFSAGGDVAGMKNADEQGDFDYGTEAKRLGNMILKIREIRKPVIASTHGACVGGALAIVLACDFIISTEDCTFKVAFAQVGLVPDMGVTYILPKVLGPMRATDLMMTAKPFSGKEACEWGLVNQAVPAEKLEEVTMKLANKLANGPVMVYAGTKALVNNVSYQGLRDQIDYEGEYQYRMGLSDDHKEAVNSFLEKRKPVFKGWS